MTLANKITVSRFILIPIMIAFIYVDLGVTNLFGNMPPNQLIFAIIFVIAALTDFLDGHIARKYNQVTTFGKFLDPIADKVLVMAAALYLLQINPNRVAVWAVMIIIFREFIITAIRLLASDKGHVIAASVYGKAKTMVTLIALIWLLFNDLGLNILWIGDVLWYLAVALTLLSGVDYFIKNRKIVFESM